MIERKWSIKNLSCIACSSDIKMWFPPKQLHFLQGSKSRNICLTNPTCGCATPSAHPVVALGS